MLRLGVDVGGTFTDFALYDAEHKVLQILQCLATPDDPARAVLAGVQNFAARGRAAH